MTDLDPKSPFAFNECLILATICGRSLLQNQQYHISQVYGGVGLNGDEQRRWLDKILTDRLRVLSECYPSPTETYDPLLLFANIFCQATVIYFCKAMVKTTPHNTADTPPGANISLDYEQRALEASAIIVKLGTALQDVPISKVCLLLHEIYRH